MAMRGQRGDTIIEVMIAFTVFAMVAVGALVVMNRGTATAQETLEMTLVRQQIDSQATALRYMAQEKTDDWKAIVADKTVNAAERFGLDDAGQCPEIPSESFALDARKGVLLSEAPKLMSDTTSSVYARVVYPDDGDPAAYGLWIQAVDGGDDFIDFHIRACWQGPGNGPPSTLGTIVRVATI